MCRAEGDDMKPFVILAAPALMLTACASAPAAKPPTTAELLLGAWTCETKADAVTIKTAPITYLDGGKSTFHISLSGSASSMAFEVVGDGEGAWVLHEEDNLEDKIVSAKVASAKMNGNPVPPAMIQGMIDQIINKSSTGAIKVTKTTMTQTTKDGQVTNCTR
jgi:hypothetical protein